MISVTRETIEIVKALQASEIGPRMAKTSKSRNGGFIVRVYDRAEDKGTRGGARIEIDTLAGLQQLHAQYCPQSDDDGPEPEPYQHGWED